MNKKKINIKDIATIGIFSAILFVITILIGALTGTIMELQMFSSSIIAVVSAPIYYLIMAKVDKKGAVITTFSVVGILWALMGGIPVLACMILAGIIGELLVSKTNYKSFKALTISYLLYIIGYYGGAIAPIYYWKDFYYSQGRPAELVDELVRAGHTIYAYAAVPTMIIAALAGTFIARTILKKHFRKAGLI